MKPLITTALAGAALFAANAAFASGSVSPAVHTDTVGARNPAIDSAPAGTSQQQRQRNAVKSGTQPQITNDGRSDTITSPTDTRRDPVWKGVDGRADDGAVR